jgi:hypothetical protein
MAYKLIISLMDGRNKDRESLLVKQDEKEI